MTLTASRWLALALTLTLIAQAALMWKLYALERLTLKLQSGDIIVCSKLWQGKNGSWVYSCIQPQKGEQQ